MHYKKLISTLLLVCAVGAYAMERSRGRTPGAPPPSEEDVEMGAPGGALPGGMHPVAPGVLGGGDDDSLSPDELHERIVRHALQSKAAKGHSPETVRKAIAYMRDKQHGQYGKLGHRARIARGRAPGDEESMKDSLTVLRAITSVTSEERNTARGQRNLLGVFATTAPILLAIGWGVYAKVSGTDPNTCGAEFTDLLGNMTQQISGVVANVTHLLVANATGGA